MKAVMDVATPVIVRTPLGFSTMYTPGWASVSAMSVLSMQ
jgi:hypothetical protein